MFEMPHFILWTRVKALVERCISRGSSGRLSRWTSMENQVHLIGHRWWLCYVHSVIVFNASNSNWQTNQPNQMEFLLLLKKWSTVMTWDINLLDYEITEWSLRNCQHCLTLLSVSSQIKLNTIMCILHCDSVCTVLYTVFPADLQ